jgi:diguanylate cyclase (GGDEF)-like protein
MTRISNHYLSWIDTDKELHCELLEPSKGTVTIGRTDLADIEIFNTSVSRKHIVLSWINGCLNIKDLNSSFGTWIENTRLTTGQNKALTTDTEIRLGNLSMWYEIRNGDESQEMMQTCFLTPKANNDIELSSEINNFRVKLQNLLHENLGDNTLNAELINGINEELLILATTQERRLKEQRILNSISHVLNRSLTQSELLKTALNLVSKVLNAARGFVLLRSSVNGENKIFAKRHFEQIKWINNNTQLHEFSHSLVNSCIEQNKIVIISDTQLMNDIDDLFETKQGGGRSIVIIPLVQDSNVIGVIYLDNQQQPHNFDNQQIPFLTTYAAHTSIALHNTLLYKRAITDDLTQLFTRQHIDEGLAVEIKNAQLHQQDLSILILDLDHFKLINDEFGHTTGDQVLQAFSIIITEHIRNKDMAGRFGGEEFIVILPNTDIKNAHKLSEKIRLAIENKSIIKDEQVIQVTVSIGAASYQASHTDKALLLIEDADKALYQAKENGRNQTVCYI